MVLAATQQSTPLHSNPIHSIIIVVMPACNHRLVYAEWQIKKKYDNNRKEFITPLLNYYDGLALLKLKKKTIIFYHKWKQFAPISRPWDSPIKVATLKNRLIFSQIKLWKTFWVVHQLHFVSTFSRWIAIIHRRCYYHQLFCSILWSDYYNWRNTKFLLSSFKSLNFDLRFQIYRHLIDKHTICLNCK